MALLSLDRAIAVSKAAVLAAMSQEPGTGGLNDRAGGGEGTPAFSIDAASAAARTTTPLGEGTGISVDNMAGGGEATAGFSIDAASAAALSATRLGEGAGGGEATAVIEDFCPQASRSIFTRHHSHAPNAGEPAPPWLDQPDLRSL